MANRNTRPEGGDVGDTENDAAAAAADDAELKGHLAFEGDRDAVHTVNALRGEGARLGEGSEDETAQPDPEFREGLRDKLVNRGTEGGDDNTEE